MNLTFIEHYSTKAEYTFFLTAHKTFTKIKLILGDQQISMKFKELKSYKVCSPITMELNQKSITERCLEITKHFDTKQHTPKQAMGQRRNHNGNWEIF